jgi:single-strand DNA-binding protein
MNISVKGNLGSDPDLKFSKNNTAYCNFSLAYTPRKQVNGEWQDGETMWFKVVAFGTKAEAIADTFRKGDTVLVTGELAQSTFTDKADGKERVSLEIIAKEVGLVPKLGKPKSGQFATKEATPW